METFVERTLSLITQERDTETLESQENLARQLEHPSKLESQGICITRLHVGSQVIGLYGRHVVTFEQSLAGHKQLPSTEITTGDIVGVYSHGRSVAEKDLSGIVVRKDTHSLTVGFDQLDDSLSLSSHDGALMIVKLANDVTYRRMKRALDDLRVGKRSQHLGRILFGEQELGSPDPNLSSTLMNQTEIDKFPFFNQSLNDSQRRAVLFALSRPDVAVIHGPPGTGKTTTIVELILQAVGMGVKVLACAPSNIAVDNMVERLAHARAKVVRIGHPARLSESIQQLSLDALLHNVDSAEIILDVRKDIKKALNGPKKGGALVKRRKKLN